MPNPVRPNEVVVFHSCSTDVERVDVCNEILAQWQTQMAPRFVKGPACEIRVDPVGSNSTTMTTIYTVFCRGKPTQAYLKILGIKK